MCAPVNAEIVFFAKIIRGGASFIGFVEGTGFVWEEKQKILLSFQKLEVQRSICKHADLFFVINVLEGTTKNVKRRINSFKTNLGVVANQMKVDLALISYSFFQARM